MILKKKNYTRNVLGDINLFFGVPEHDLKETKESIRNVLDDINLFFGVPQHDLLERGGESWEEGEVWALQAEGATNTCGSRFYVEYF